MKMIHRGEKGFTLIELLIVVAILGIIAAVPNVAGFMTTGQLSAANSEVEQVKTARMGYFGDNGRWPNTSEDLRPTYLTGSPKAVYDIDDDFGWIIDVTSNNWTTAIEFEQGESGENGHDGRWVRATTP